MGSQSPRDTYRQIADTLRAEISDSSLSGEHGRLGSEAELSDRFRVARNTLRRALNELARDGLIYSVPTKGWFVGRPTTDAKPADQTAIAAELAREIQDGHPAPGEKLATAPQIARRYGVTMYIARQALITLSAKGLIESHHGKGWFVCESSK
ncbi:GntR family transcriptional regulator [Actinocrinis sp.]|uniref:GntR family transcriptional regulator n=1 Tax=Actinocrinis sp. TaxID=1920516 RepID=UPI0039C87B92